MFPWTPKFVIIDPFTPKNIKKCLVISSNLRVCFQSNGFVILNGHPIYRAEEHKFCLSDQKLYITNIISFDIKVRLGIDG